jgi:hypothetical protein
MGFQLSKPVNIENVNENDIIIAWVELCLPFALMAETRSGSLARPELGKARYESSPLAIVKQRYSAKSKFINTAAGGDILPVGRTLRPETREIQHVECTITRNNEQRRVIFVEAPGFDSEKEDKIEKKLRSWLKKM